MNKTLIALALFLAIAAPAATFAGPVAGTSAAGPSAGAVALIPVLQAYLAAPHNHSVNSPLARLSDLKLDYAHDRAIALPLLEALASAGLSADSALDDQTVEAAYLSAHFAESEKAVTRLEQVKAMSEATDLKELARGLRESDAYGAVYLDSWNHEGVVAAQNTVKKAAEARLSRKIQSETKGWSTAGVESQLKLHEGVATEKQYWKHVDTVIDSLHRVAGKVKTAEQLEGARFMVASAERAIAAGRKDVTIAHPEKSRYYSEAWVADASMRGNTYDSKGRARYSVLKAETGDTAGIAAVKARLDAIPNRLQAAQELEQLVDRRDALVSASARHFRIYGRMPANAGKESWAAYQASDKKRVAAEAELQTVERRISEIKQGFPELRIPVAGHLIAAASAFGAGASALLLPLDKVFEMAVYPFATHWHYATLTQTLLNHPLRLFALTAGALLGLALVGAAISRALRRP